MIKRFKYGIAISIIIFVIFFIIASIISVETETFCNKYNDNSYSFNNYKRFQPFNYNIDDVFSVWLTGISIIFIFIYVFFINKKEVNINKAQKFILAIIVPIIIFISFLAAIQFFDISTLEDAWLFTVITLILIAIFEYDLFGNKTIISLFDYKLLIKVIIFSIFLFFIIGILGELIPPFTISKKSEITKTQYEQYKGEKLDWSQIELPKSLE